MSNHRRRCVRRGIVAAAAVLLLVASGSASAQVGHPPGSSPYRDLSTKFLISLVGAYAAGSGGSVDAGPSTGPLGGARFDLHLGGPGVIHFSLMGGSLERRIIDPRLGPGNRDLGAASGSMLLAEGGAALVLTGEKTWHGMAPYAGASLGIALGGDVPEDTTQSGFRFGTKFTVGPHIGIQLYPTRRFMLRLEARDMLWRLRYPITFTQEPENAPGEDPVLAEAKSTEWTHNPMLVIAVGFAIPR